MKYPFLIGLLFMPAVVLAQPFLLCESHGFNNDNQGCMLVDAAGKRLTPKLFNTLDAQPQSGMIRVVKRVPDEHGGDWFYSYMSIDGKAMLPPESLNKDDTSALKLQPPRRYASQDKLSSFKEGLARVCDHQRGCGYLAPDGTWALPPNPSWAEAHDFHHGLALVRGPGYVTDPGPMSSIGPQHIRQPWSVINKSGRIVMGYDPATEKNLINPSKAERVLGQRYGSYTRPEIDIQSDFIDGVAAFLPGIPYGLAHNMGIGLVDTKGKIVVKPSTKYYREDELRDKYFPMEDRKPSLALNKKFCIRDDFYDGLALAYKSCWTNKHGLFSSDEKGFINRQGQWVIKPFKFVHLEVPFRDGHAVIQIYEPELQNTTKVLIDRTGTIVAHYRKLLKPTEAVEK